MKVLVFLLLTLFAFSCDKNQGELPNDDATVFDIILDIAPAVESRVAFANYSYSWEEGAKIGLFMDYQSAIISTHATVAMKDGRGYCTVPEELAADIDAIYGYAPYSAQNSDANSVQLTIPSVQKLSYAGDFLCDAMPMVAEPCMTAEGKDKLLFQPLGGILCYNIYASSEYQSEKVSSVVYTTTKPISGNFKYDVTQAELSQITTDNNSVQCLIDTPYSLTAKKDSATPIYAVIAPGAYSGTLKITTDAAIYSYDYSLNVAQNHYYNVNIDLSKATNRKSLTPSESVTATLTYAECKDVIAGYKSPKTYTNSYGSWTICAYNHNDIAIQLNDNKVAYIGTPTFSGIAQSLSLTLTENYSDDLYICTSAGNSSASDIVKSIPVNGKSATVEISDLNLRSFYIRSGACMRISAIEITYGGDDGGTVLPDPTPDPDPTPEPEPEPEPTPTPTPTPDPDPTPEPEPEPEPTPTPTSRYVWAELPVIDDANRDGVHDSDSNIYYAHHLCAGGEKNAQRNDTARNYTVCYSGKHHCPLWVAAPRHAMYEKKGTDRTDAYGKDPKIPSSVQYNSKSTGGGCNKGHMLGSAERICSAATNRQVFYYTNIAPQYSSSFNTGGGAWNNLEDHIDGLVCSDTLYVVVGCYFERFSRNGATATPKTISFGGRSDVSCPTMFYYALLRTKKGNTGKRVQDCSASELQCAAFTISHTMSKGHEPEAADMMSISELEKLTGFSYFTNVPNAPKGTFSSSDWL